MAYSSSALGNFFYLYQNTLSSCSAVVVFFFSSFLIILLLCYSSFSPVKWVCTRWARYTKETHQSLACSKILIYVCQKDSNGWVLFRIDFRKQNKTRYRFQNKPLPFLCLIAPTTKQNLPKHLHRADSNQKIVSLMMLIKFNYANDFVYNYLPFF